MNIWIVTVGEPIPADGKNVRLHRSGIMSRMASAMGHEVHWFNSRFDHFAKENRSTGGNFELGKDYTLHLLEGVSYRKNISFNRILNHVQIAKDFDRKISSMTAPDVILCSFPTIELSESCVRFGKKNNVPVFVDVRDLWPDIFVDILPAPLKWIGRTILFSLYKSTRYALTNADAITAVSDKYLQWGLNYAKRKAEHLDTVFPLAYPMLEAEWQADPESEARCKGLGIKPSGKIALFIGTFGRTYDLTSAIEGVKAVNASTSTPVQLILCGEGDFGSKWRQLADNDANIIFTGWVEKPDLEYLMSIANTGVAAYAQGAPQGVPNKIIEYLARGLPILSSLQGETEELISTEHCGLSYSATSSQAFSDALLNILEEDVYQQMSSNASKLYSRKYAAESVYREFITLLEASKKSR